LAVVCLAVGAIAASISVRSSRASTDAAPPEGESRRETTPAAADAAAPVTSPPTEPGWKTKRDAFVARGAADVRVVPATELGASPPAVLTMLHGMGSSTAKTCARVERAATWGMTVLCPTGNVDYGNGHADWTGEGEQKAAHVDAAMSAALDPLSLAPSATRGDVLMGFSRGAFVARDVAYARPGKWKALVLVGAALVPEASLLRASGIKRVVLASGDFDGAKKTMLAARTKLCTAGIPARFVSLGPVWHDFPADSMERLEASIAWARGEGDAADATCPKAGS
jgi:predicted esterase